jgi:hypothetical protein
MRNGLLHGWIWNAALPDIPVLVDLFDNDEHLARAVANQYRGDVQRPGMRIRPCGFAFQLPGALLDGACHTLRVCIAGTATEVAGGPVHFGRLPIMPLFEELTRLRLKVDRLTRIVEELAEPNSNMRCDLARTIYERAHAYGEFHREVVERKLDALRKVALCRFPIGNEAATPGEALTGIPSALTKSASR